jgi:hypothetical protein
MLLNGVYKKYGIQVKVKFILEQDTGIEGIAPIFLQPRRQMGWVANTTPPPLCIRERDSVLILLKGGWAPGPV